MNSTKKGHASLTFTAGILLCGKIREYLESRRFEGFDFEWREGRGWIEREWIIRGTPTAVRLIHGDIKAWVKDNELTPETESDGSKASSQRGR